MKVNAHLGGTFPFPEGLGFGNVKLGSDIEVETEGDVEAQIHEGIDVTVKIWTAQSNQTVITVQDEIGKFTGNPGIMQRVGKLETQNATNAENIKRIAARLKDTAPAIAEEVKKVAKDQAPTE